MKRKNLFLSILLVILLASPSLAESHRVSSQKSDFIVNNQPLEFKTIKIRGSNYLTIRDFASILNGSPDQFDVSWNEETRQVEILTDTPYQDGYSSPDLKNAQAIKSKASIVLDGVEKEMDSYLVKGNTCFKLRDLTQLIDVNIFWRHTDSTVVINSNKLAGPKTIDSKLSLISNLREAQPSRFGMKYNSFLIDDGGGNYSILEHIFDPDKYDIDDKYISLESYNKSNKLIDSKKIEKELPIFDSFYQGENYNYILFGDYNREEDPFKPVIALVKYDKNFNKLDSLTIKAGEANVVVPFNSGSTDMTEKDNVLTVHTARKRFKADDGLNHQSQLTFNVNTSSMTLLEPIKDFQDNHVSHSFNQFVLNTEIGPVYLDHGDAYPRSLVITRPGPNGRPSRQEFFRIPGETGMNATGVSLGGFERLGDGFLVAFNSVDHSKVKSYTNYELEGLETENRDIILFYTDLYRDQEIGSRKFTVKNYSNTDMYSSVPELVALDRNNILLIWEEFDRLGKSNGIIYRLVTLEGKDFKFGDEKKLSNFQLSRCQPRLIDGKVSWIANVNYVDSPENISRIKFDLDF